MYEKLVGYAIEYKTSISTATISPGKGDQLAVAVKLSTGDEHKIRLLNAETGDLEDELAGHDAEIVCLYFSPDGKYLLSAAKDNMIKYWNLSTKKLEKSIENVISGVGSDRQHCYISSICFSPDSRFLCFTADNLKPSAMVTWTWLFNAETKEEICAPISGSISKCRSFNQRCQFSPSSKDKWLAAIKDQYVIIFSVHHLQKKGHGGPDTIEWKSEKFDDYTYALAYSPDGNRLIAADDNGTIRVWSIKENKLMGLVGKELQVEQTHYMKSCGYYSINNIQILPTKDLQFLIGFYENWGKMVVFKESEKDKSTFVEARILRGHRDDAGLITAELSSDCNRLVSASRDSLVVWEMPKRDGLIFEDHSARVSAVCFSADGKELASAAGLPDCSIRVWCLDSGKERLRMMVSEDSKAPIEYLTYQPSNSNVIVAGHSDGVIRLWNTVTGEHIGLINPPESIDRTEALMSCIFSPSGSYIISSWGDSYIRVWSSETRECVNVLATGKEKSEITVLAITPGDQYLATGRLDGSVQLWNMDDLFNPPATIPSGKKQQQTRQEPKIRKTAQIYDDDDDFAEPKAQTIYPFAAYRGHQADIVCLAFSPDFKLMFTAASKGRILGWRVGPGEHDSNPLYDIKDSEDTKFLFFDDISRLRSISDLSVYTWRTDYSGWKSRYFIDGINQAITVGDVHPDVAKKRQSKINKKNAKEEKVEAKQDFQDYFAIGSFDCSVKICKVGLEQPVLHLRGKIKPTVVDADGNPIETPADNPDSSETKVVTSKFHSKTISRTHSKAPSNAVSKVTSVQYTDDALLNEKPDWFQVAIQKSLEVLMRPETALNEDLSGSKEKLGESFNFRYTELPTDSHEVGIWIEKSSIDLINLPSIENRLSINRILIETSPRVSSSSILVGILKEMEASQRKHFVEFLVSQCLDKEKFKLQKCFDYLAEVSDEMTIEDFLDCILAQGTVWVPVVRPDHLDTASLRTYFKHIQKCIALDPKAIRPSIWKYITRNLQQLIREAPDAVVELFNSISYYPVPNHKSDQSYVANMKSDQFQIAPQPFYWSKHPADLYFRDNDDDTMYDFLKTCYSRRDGTIKWPSPSSSSARLKGSWSSYVWHKVRKFIRKKVFPNSKQLGSKEIVACYVPLYRFHDNMLKSFSDEIKGNELLKTPAMKVLVEYKWRSFGFRLYLIWLAAYLAMVTAFFITHFTLLGSDKAGLEVTLNDYIGYGVVAGISACFLLIEVVELFSSETYLSYFKSLANWLDCYSYIVPVLHLTNLIFDLVQIPPLILAAFMAFTTIILFFELLNLMVAAGELGKFIRMFFEVIKATFNFMLTLLLFIFAFLLAFATLAFYTPSTSVFLTLYFVLIGQKDLDSITSQLQEEKGNSGTPVFDTGIITLFVIFTFFVMIIMLNLLIAIIGDIYGKVMEDIDAVIVRSKLNMLTKIERIYRWNSKTAEESQSFPDWMVYVVPEDICREYKEKKE